MAIAFGCAFAKPSPHRSENFLDYLLTDFVSNFSLVVGCGSTLAKVLPNMFQSSLNGYMSVAPCVCLLEVNVAFKQLRSYVISRQCLLVAVVL